jgi:hypothetical protein
MSPFLVVSDDPAERYAARAQIARAIRSVVCAIAFAPDITIIEIADGAIFYGIRSDPLEQLWTAVVISTTGLLCMAVVYTGELADGELPPVGLEAVATDTRRLEVANTEHLDEDRSVSRLKKIRA